MAKTIEPLSVNFFTRLLPMPPVAPVIIIFFSFYSGLIEIIQPYVNRFREIEDFLFNNLGIFIGLTLGIFINKIINKNKLLN